MADFPDHAETAGVAASTTNAVAGLNAKAGADTSANTSIGAGSVTVAQYVKLITRALKNERVSFIRKNALRWDNETPLTEFDERCGGLADRQALEAFDVVDSSFEASRYSVTVGNALLYEALARLDGTKRAVVLMAHGLNISDAEIGGELSIGRCTVNRMGKRGLNELRETLEGEGFRG